MIRTLLYWAVGLMALPLARGQEEIQISYRDHLVGVSQGTKVLIPHEYEALWRIHEADTLYWARQNGLWGVIGLSGQVKIPLQYHLRDEYDLYLDGDSYLTAEQPVALRNPAGRWGAINYLGKEFLPFEYDFAYAHRAGADENWNWYYDFYVEKKGKVQHIQRGGKVKHLPYKYFGGPAYHPSANQAFWLSKDGKSYVLYDTREGAELSMKDFQQGLMGPPIIHQKGQYYLLDNQGKKISKGYDHLEFGRGRYSYCQVVYSTKNGKKGLLSWAGEEWLSCIAQEVDYAVQWGVHAIAYRLHPKEAWKFKVSKDGKTFTDLAIEADSFELYYYHYLDDPNDPKRLFSIAIQQKGQWGTIDFDGNTLLPCAYQEPIMFDLLAPERYVPVKQNDKYAYVNAKGQFLTKFEFDEADHFYPDLTDKTEPLRAKVKQGAREGKLCLDGQVIWD
jgi:hypothetical protein